MPTSVRLQDINCIADSLLFRLTYYNECTVALHARVYVSPRVDHVKSYIINLSNVTKKAVQAKHCCALHISNGILAYSTFYSSLCASVGVVLSLNVFLATYHVSRFPRYVTRCHVDYMGLSAVCWLK